MYANASWIGVDIIYGWIAIKPAVIFRQTWRSTLEGASHTWSWRSVIDCWRSENFVEVWAKQRIGTCETRFNMIQPRKFMGTSRCNVWLTVVAGMTTAPGSSAHPVAGIWPWAAVAQVVIRKVDVLQTISRFEECTRELVKTQGFLKNCGWRTSMSLIFLAKS